MQITKIGLDLAKQNFHLVGLNQANRVVLKKKLRRSQVLPYFAKLEACCVVMEACAGSHYWARELEKLGHTVKLIAPHHVKPFVQGSKNDYNDALAITEAADRPKMHQVRPKTVEQQDLQSLQRMREAVVAQRTALCNQIRGLSAEYGVIIPQGAAKLTERLSDILEDAENGLTIPFRTWLQNLQSQLQQLNAHIKFYDNELKQRTKQDHDAKRLMTIPGFGPVVAATFISVVGDGRQFQRGRDVSAFTGLVPRQHSTGGKQVLLGITKRGSKQLRAMLVQGAQSVLQHAHKKDDALSRWVVELVERRGRNKAVVALANKLARIAWAVLTSGGGYQVKAL